MLPVFRVCPQLLLQTIHWASLASPPLSATTRSLQTCICRQGFDEFYMMHFFSPQKFTFPTNCTLFPDPPHSFHRPRHSFPTKSLCPRSLLQNVCNSSDTIPTFPLLRHVPLPYLPPGPARASPPPPNHLPRPAPPSRRSLLPLQPTHVLHSCPETLFAL